MLKEDQLLLDRLGNLGNATTIANGVIFDDARYVGAITNQKEGCEQGSSPEQQPDGTWRCRVKNT